MPIMRFRELATRTWSWLTAYRFSGSDPKPIDKVISLALGLDGASVTRDAALSVPGVLRARNLICGSIATLPLVQRDEGRRPVRSALLDQHDPDIANVVTMAQTVEDLLFDAISWWEILERGPGNFPVKVRRRDPNTVSLQPPGQTRSPSPLPSGEDPRGATVYVDGRPVAASNMIRFDSPNPGILAAAKRPIRRAVFLDRMAELYAKNPRPLDYFAPREDADPADDDDIRQLLADWRAAREEGSTAYIPYALEYHAVDVPTPADLQLLEQQRHAALEIARATGLDPEDLGVSTTSRTYQNAVDRRQDKINECFASYMGAITGRLSMPDVTAPGHRVVFVLDEYLRADPTTRWNVYGIGIDKGIIDAEEARAREGLPAGAPERPAAARDGSGDLPDNVRPLRAAGRTVIGFDAGGARHFDVPLRHFAVDRERRTIEGLAVPYGEVATKWWQKWEFAPGALQLAGTSPELLRRNKLLRDHDYAQALGVLVFHEDRPDGVFVRYRVAAGPEGDRALELAAEGVLDGFSVGVDFEDADTTPHPTKRGVTLIRRATWPETSLTAMPSFDGARVTRVAASQTGGHMDPCATCGHRHAQGTPCVAPANVASLTLPTTGQPAPAPVPAPVTFGAWPAGQPAPAPAGQPVIVQQPGAAPLATLQTAAGPMQFALPNDPASLAATLQVLGVMPQANPATAGTVNPAAHPVPGQPAGQPATFVREPEPYRFDRRGNLTRGSHDFSTDLIAFARGDETAGRRALEFVQRAFDRMNFVVTTDVDELNPTRQRPDMYVDQRTFRYPVWEAINKGTLTDITPFTFPKFNSASGLVANHTEGTEPSLGTFTATGQTVTPTAVSGKVKITRETWDQGGNPQVSGLIWRQMLKAWFEALEAFAVATLDAATPTAIALTAGGGTTGQTLDQELTAAFAGLQFVRGGFTMDNMFTQIDLYKAMVAAADDGGRRLYPAIGPQNATGTVGNRFGAIDVNGVTAYPAWALAASGSVVASSYLFDSAVVHGWASAPQRIDIDRTEVANVYIGLWGYKAAAISDIAGVREITYDPVP